MKTTLHGFYRSSATFRVRIALNLKGSSYETESYDIPSLEHESAEYLAINPQGLLPTLSIDGHLITQSLAIIDYLEATRPLPALYPGNVAGRTRVLSLALAVGADIHPLGSARVIRHLRETTDLDEARLREWQQHWIERGFSALEAMLSSNSRGRFSYGDSPTVADVFIVPQVLMARRIGVHVEHYPIISSIVDECLALPAFEMALPER